MLGRPSDYTQELATLICEKIGLGQSMRSVCEEDGMPTMQTVWRWLREKPDFNEQYRHATEERTEAQQEMLLEMGDKAIAHAEEADFKAAAAVVNAYKLKADNFKWSMSKMKPKKYGDKLDVTSDGKALPTPIYGGQSTVDAVQGHNSNQKDIPAQ